MIRKQCYQTIIALVIVAVCIYESDIFQNKSIKSPSATSQPNPQNVKLNSLWALDGIEIPYEPSTRTRQSAKSFEQFQTWFTFQNQLRLEMSNLDHVNILFYGDSITESLVGTSYGTQCTTDNLRCRNIPEMFQSALNMHNLSAHVSAISGDRTQHLLWRLKHGGELPAAIHPDVVVLLIGTNNVAHDPVHKIARGIISTVEFIHRTLPNATVLVNDVFPRHDHVVKTIGKLRQVEELNSLLKTHFGSKYQGSISNDQARIVYLQCGYLFKPTSNQATNDKDVLVNVDLMPDRLHPNAVGMEKWLSECIIPHALSAK